MPWPATVPGANLAVAAMLRLKAEAAEVPVIGLLFYGVYDDDFDSPSYLQFAEGPGLTPGQDAALLELVSAGTGPPFRSPDLAVEGVGPGVAGAAAPLSECPPG